MYMSNGTAVLTIDMASASMAFKGPIAGTVGAITAGYAIDSSGSTEDDYMSIVNISTTVCKGMGRGSWADGGAS
jgi:hypothetical protein